MFNKKLSQFKIVLIFIFGMIVSYLAFGGSNNLDIAEEHADHEDEKQQEEIYTCSMHPQIENIGEGDCPLCGMDLIPKDNDASSIDKNAFKLSDDAIKMSNIETQVVEMDEAFKSIFLQGEIEVDESLVSMQSMHFSGRIEKLFVNYEGQKVNKGDLIAVVYSPELVTAQNEFLNSVKLKEKYPKLYNSAKQKLYSWKLSKRQVRKIEKNNKTIEYFNIYSENTGFIANKSVDIGDYVKQGGMLFKIVDYSKLWISFDVYEKDLPFIKLDDIISFSLNSESSYGNTILDDDGEFSVINLFESKVSFIEPTIDRKKRVVKVRTEIENNDNFLKPGMFVKGELKASLYNHIEDDDEFIIIPKTAVMWTGQRSLIYIAKEVENGRDFEARAIELGVDLGDTYTVLSGLEEDEEIVISGTFTVDAAAQLNNKFSMMNFPTFDSGKEKEIEFFDFKSSTPEVFSRNLASFMESYLDLKDNLVLSDETKTQDSAIKLLSILENLGSDNFNNKENEFWEKRKEDILTYLKPMAEKKDLLLQREHFKPLSNNIISVISSFKVAETSDIFVQFCPMAFDNIGASWISSNEEIRNPYFGDAMLKCGEITKTITN